jgi:hypothetical protein
MYMSGITYRASREISLDALSDGKPKAIVDVAKKTGLSKNQVGYALMLAWHRGLVLRTAKAIYQEERVFKGRNGVSVHAN